MESGGNKFASLLTGLNRGLNNVCACAKIKSNFRANARERDVWFFHVQLNDNWQKTKIFHYFGTYTKIYPFNDVKSDNLNTLKFTSKFFR